VGSHGVGRTWETCCAFPRWRSLAGHCHLGQYLFVYPELDVVVARFGTSTGGVASWRAVFDEIARAASRLLPVLRPNVSPWFRSVGTASFRRRRHGLPVPLAARRR